MRAQGFVIFCLGDFNSRVGQITGLENNTPDSNNNTPMFINFINQVNLVIVNTLPIAKGLFTRFMDNTNRPGTESLLDYGLVDSEHVHTVTSFIIDADARFDAGTDHALLIAKLEFGITSTVNWSLEKPVSLNFNSETDFSEYQAKLDQMSSTVPLHQFENLSCEDMLPHIMNSIKESGNKVFGLKIKHKKIGMKFPRPIIDKIKIKNELSRQVALAHVTLDPQVDVLQLKLDSLKSDIRDLCCQNKLKRRQRIRAKCLLADPNRKKFWSFLKNQMKIAGRITGAYDKTGNMVFNQDEIEEAVIDHFQTIFAGQRVPVFPLSESPDQLDLAIEDIENLLRNSPVNIPENKFESQVCSPYSFLELNQILSSLKSGKASGYDAKPNELLKNCSLHFKNYLLIFLNKILGEGRVPQQLNLGRCMLIYKVCKTKLLKLIDHTKFSRGAIPYQLHNTAP